VPQRDRVGLHERDDGRLLEGGRQDPADFEYNVQVTLVVEMAHERGVTVEGELGTLGGSRTVWAPARYI
jgi:hypothetical protein